jgi:NADH-quinone oxidoreductase subunit C
MLPDHHDLIARISAAVPGATVTAVENPSPAAQHSLLLDPAHAVEVARFLRDDPALKFDFCSNATGVDWPDSEVKEKTKVVQLVDGQEKEVETTITRAIPGCLEAVYHLFSMPHRHGPLVIRLRTGNRSDDVHLPAMTPVWRSCEFQEREIFDLFGIVFDGHPDLRRLMMWENFTGHPMRRDYVEPDDYEWEPTPHDEVLAKAKRHLPTQEPTPAP